VKTLCLLFLSSKELSVVTPWGELILLKLASDPVDCHDYYICADMGGGQWDVKHFECGPDLAFNPELLICDWPEHVPGCD
jgi:hypothetical protein